jgi:hypothetical protein
MRLDQPRSRWLLPTTVTDIDPDVAEFAATIDATALSSYVTCLVTVRRRALSTIVTAANMLESEPCGIRPDNDDDEIHDVTSPPLVPTRNLKLLSDAPMFHPTTVTLVVPVVAVFLLTSPLRRCASYVNNDPDVPTWGCTVAPMMLDENSKPIPCFVTNPLSLIHIVASVALPPRRLHVV